MNHTDHEGGAEGQAAKAAEARGRERLAELYKSLADASFPSDADTSFPDGAYRIEIPAEDGSDTPAVLVPRWQFIGESVESGLRPELPELREEAKEAGLDAIGFTSLMLNPRAGSGKSPVELLDAGEKDLVVGIIRAQDL